MLTVTEDSDGLLFQADPVTGSESRMLDLNAKPDGSHAGSAFQGEIVQTPQGRIVAAIDAIDRHAAGARSPAAISTPARLAAVPGAHAARRGRPRPGHRPARHVPDEHALDRVPAARPRRPVRAPLAGFQARALARAQARWPRIAR